MPARGRQRLPTLAALCSAPDDYLDAIDIAGLNLVSATGLPGAERLQFDQIFNWLDEAARKVDIETRRHWYRFVESPQLYHSSPGYFCCYFLLQVLQEEFSVRYNPDRAADANFQDPKCLNPDFRDSRDLFIHGIINGPGGTCASMPVLYVAVGRRLGYPLKLVESRGHLFFRWDDPLGQRLGLSERFNVEGSGFGINSFPDEYYRTWPEPWTAAETAANVYLRSFSPRAELAAFLCTRAECLHDNDRVDEAIQAYQFACALAPNDPRYRWQLGQLIWRRQRNVFEMNEVIALGRQARALDSQQVANFTRTLPSPIGGPAHGFHFPPHAPAPCASHHPKCQCQVCRQQRPLPSTAHPPHCACSTCRRAVSAARQSRVGHMPTCDRFGGHRPSSVAGF